MDDLDAMLDNTAAEMLPTVFDLDATLKEKKIIDDVKPWLAFSSNVPQSKRDSWTKMVKVDALAELLPTCRPSNIYYSWEKPGAAPVYGGEKLLQEVVRNAANAAGIDDSKTTKLVNMANPVVDQEGAKHMQDLYRAQLLKDVAPVVKKDANFTAEKFPHLAKSLGE